MVIRLTNNSFSYGAYKPLFVALPFFVQLIIFLLLFSLSQVASATGGRDPYVYFFDETWGNFAEELIQARKSGKRGILLFFEMDECPFCHRMKEMVLNQPEVQAYYKKNFLIYSIDIESDVDMVDFSGNKMSQKVFSFNRNRVRATPVFAFYDLDGKQIMRYTGATSSLEEFMWLGEYVATGIYKKERFIKFKRRKKSAARAKQ